MEVHGVSHRLPARMRAAAGVMGHLLLGAASDGAAASPESAPVVPDLDPLARAGAGEDTLVMAAALTEVDSEARLDTALAAARRPAAPSAQAVADTALVRLVQAGDMAAFEELFHKYKGTIYRTALAITRDAGAAEEVLQDCFYKTYVNIQRIQPDLPLSPWLHRVAVNLSCNVLKRRRTWLEPLENITERLFADPHHSPEQLFEQTELQGLLREIVNELPLKHRVVVVLHYLQDLSLPEIAVILDCPVGTVKSRLHYARKVLKVAVEERYLAGQPVAVAKAVQTQKA